MRSGFPAEGSGELRAAGRPGRWRGLAILLTLAVSIAIPGCGKKGRLGSPGSSVVAVAGEREVEYDAFADYVRKAAREDARSVSPQVASSLLDQYIEEILLDLAAEQALGESKGTSPEERRRELINRRSKLGEITEDELRAEYQKHLDLYQKPEMMRLSQMILPDKEKAELARKRLGKGESWLDVSREMSQAPNKASGGALGFLSRKDLPRDFEKVIWTQKPGAVTAPVPSGSGFHIFKVEERLDGRTVSFEEARAALRLALAEQRASVALEAILKESLGKNPVAILEDHLPFPYVGRLPRRTER